LIDWLCVCVADYQSLYLQGRDPFSIYRQNNRLRERERERERERVNGDNLFRMKTLNFRKLESVDSSICLLINIDNWQGE
jgi:hypothetical protein